MSKQEYLESIFKDFCEGLISEDAYDAALRMLIILQEKRLL